MKDNHPAESRFEPRHKRTNKSDKDAVMANDSAMLNPCAKRKKLPTIEEQFSDNDWKIVR
jgi:hypothetical protein